LLHEDDEGLGAEWVVAASEPGNVVGVLVNVPEQLGLTLHAKLLQVLDELLELVGMFQLKFADTCSLADEDAHGVGHLAASLAKSPKVKGSQLLPGLLCSRSRNTHVLEVVAVLRGGAVVVLQNGHDTTFRHLIFPARTKNYDLRQKKPVDKNLRC
jgi:hypothetical protein